MADLANNLLQAMSMVAKSEISNAGFDKTLMATIVSCEDQVSGKYKVKYQDSTWVAYSSNTEMVYSKGANVYILVPSNNMSSNKTIIGLVSNLGTQYIDYVNSSNRFIQNSDNLVTDNNGTQYSLCSYIEDDSESIYNFEDLTHPNLEVKINQTNQYLSQSDCLKIQANFRTDLPFEQRKAGNYGIQITMQFQDQENSSQTIDRTYVLDIDSMTGNPYLFTSSVPQEKYFSIDNQHFIRIKDISIFAKGFNNTEYNDQPNDIFISNIEIRGYNTLTLQETQGLALRFKRPQGYIFTSRDTDNSSRIVTAQLRVEGKILSSNDNKVDYYWFKEDSNIDAASPFYSKYGGKGWRCLNQVAKQDGESTMIQSQLKFLPSHENSFYIQKSDIIIPKVQYKCTAIYNNIEISNTFYMLNLNSNYNITITCENKEQLAFYSNEDVLVLKCNVSLTDDPSAEITGLKYSWNQITEQGTRLGLETVTEAVIEDIQQQVQMGQYPDQVYAPARAVFNYSDYYCSVSRTITTIVNEEEVQQDVYIGTVSVRIFKKSDYKSRYTLLIENGNQLFNYDQNGNSPFIEELNEVHRTIPVLTFKLIDNVTEQDISENNKQIDWFKWSIPIKNTLLVDNNTVPSDEDKRRQQWQSQQHEEGEQYQSSDSDYEQYTNLRNFTYGIAAHYASNKSNNNILLELNINHIYLSATTNLLFTKEGQLGTNGTDAVCKIVPLDSEDKIVNGWLIGRITRSRNSSSTATFVPNWYTLQAQIWKDGQEVFTSDEEDANNTVNWEMLTLGDKSWYSIAENGSTHRGIVSLSNQAVPRIDDFQPQNSSTPSYFIQNGFPANLVKVTVKYNNKLYYDIIPIVTIYSCEEAGNSKNIGLQGGFKQVVYSQDGQNPKYDDTLPFFITTSDSSGFIDFIDSSDWSYVGSIRSGYTTIGSERIPTYTRIQGNDVYLKENENRQKVQTDTLEQDFLQSIQIQVGESVEEEWTPPKKWRYFTPKTIFDGSCVTNAIRVVCKNGDSRRLWIHIPIHFMLNRYGHRNLNEWDGNSIDINDKGEYILAPQVGAGIKNASNNTFTGILMGTVNTATTIGTTTSLDQEIGLFGYYEGQRTIFLDSKTGKAEFGRAGSGQIVIDPSQIDSTTGRYKAQIMSGNFVRNETTGSGMLIDLTTPEIVFGNGNFSVNSDGELTSKVGHIASWTIQNNCLYHGNPTTSTPTIGNSNSNNNYLYLGDAGFSLGKNFIYDANSGTLSLNVSSFAIGGSSVSSDLLLGDYLNFMEMYNENVNTFSGINKTYNYDYSMILDYTVGQYTNWEIDLNKILPGFGEGFTYIFTFSFKREDGDIRNLTLGCSNGPTASDPNVGRVYFASQLLVADEESGWFQPEHQGDYKVIFNDHSDLTTYKASIKFTTDGDYPLKKHKIYVYFNQIAAPSTLPKVVIKITQPIIKLTSVQSNKWQPSQYDEAARLHMAGKTATSYLYYRASGEYNGLYISENAFTDATFSGGDGRRDVSNIKITSNSMEICKGFQTLVEYGSTTRFKRWYTVGSNTYSQDAATLSSDGLTIQKGIIKLGTFGSISAVDHLPSSAVGFYVDSSGNFIFGNSASNYLKWDNTALTIQGKIIATSGQFSNFYISKDDNNRAISTGGHLFDTSLYSHLTVSGSSYTSDEQGYYEVGLRGQVSSPHAGVIYIARTPLTGSYWDLSGSTEFIYKLQASGKLVAKKAEIMGIIHSSGKSSYNDTNNGYYLDDNGNFGVRGNGYYLIVDGTNGLRFNKITFQAVGWGGMQARINENGDAYLAKNYCTQLNVSDDSTHPSFLEITPNGVFLPELAFRYSGGGTLLMMPYSYNGKIYSTSSSLRFKNIISQTVNVLPFYNLTAKIAKYKNGFLPQGHEWEGKDMPMLIAEEVDNVCHQAAFHDEKGRACDWTDRVLIPVHQQMLVNQYNKLLELQKQIKQLQKEITDYENKI